jgi:hypothetical protein
MCDTIVVKRGLVGQVCHQLIFGRAQRYQKKKRGIMVASDLSRTNGSRRHALLCLHDSCDPTHPYTVAFLRFHMYSSSFIPLPPSTRTDCCGHALPRRHVSRADARSHRAGAGLGARGAGWVGSVVG